MREILREYFENFGRLRHGDTMMTKNTAHATLKAFEGSSVPFRRDSGGPEVDTRRHRTSYQQGKGSGSKAHARPSAILTIR